MGHQTSPAMSKYYSLLICIYSNLTALEVSLGSETHLMYLSGILKFWQKSKLRSFLSRTSNISHGSPNQVKHIDSFSFRKKKKHQWERTLVVSHFQTISASLPSIFLCRVKRLLSTVKGTEFFLYLFSPKTDRFLKVKGQTSIQQPYKVC